MIKKYSIKELMEKEGEEVEVYGWVWRERGSNKIKFVTLRDSTDVLQCVIEKEKLGDEKFDVADKIQVETAMKIIGIIKKDERAPSGYEVNATDFEIIGDSKDFPISKDFSVEFLLDNRHLWLRSRKMIAMMKVRSTIFGAIDEYFRSKGFYEYHSPIFQSVQCEGGSTLFEVPYFDKKGVFLAQTWQLYAEPALMALEKIYTIAPSFRAEKSKTSRHLTEYWHAEMEVAWAEFDDILNYGEELIKHVVKKVLDNHENELKILKRDPEKLRPCLEKPFPRLTYDEALKILKEKCDMEVEWGKDLRTIEEDKISQLYDTPIMVTRYPKKVKAFYMKEPEDSDPEKPVVNGVDFIAPEGYGEIIGGSERESDIEKIKDRLREDNEDPAEYDFYLDSRRYGSIPHGGFGFGVERVITWICGLDNIKDSIPFPRTMLRYKP